MIFKNIVILILILFSKVIKTDPFEEEYDLSHLTEEQIKIIKHLRSVDDNLMYELDNELEMARKLDKRLDNALGEVDEQEDFLKLGGEL